MSFRLVSCDSSDGKLARSQTAGVRTHRDMLDK